MEEPKSEKHSVGRRGISGKSRDTTRKAAPEVRAAQEEKAAIRIT